MSRKMHIRNRRQIWRWPDCSKVFRLLGLICTPISRNYCFAQSLLVIESVIESVWLEPFCIRTGSKNIIKTLVMSELVSENQFLDFRHWRGGFSALSARWFSKSRRVWWFKKGFKAFTRSCRAACLVPPQTTSFWNTCRALKLAQTLSQSSISKKKTNDGLTSWLLWLQLSKACAFTWWLNALNSLTLLHDSYISQPDSVQRVCGVELIIFVDLKWDPALTKYRLDIHHDRGWEVLATEGGISKSPASTWKGGSCFEI